MIFSLLAVSKCLPHSVLILLYIAHAYGILCDMEVVSPIFLYLSHCLKNFCSQPQAKSGGKKKKSVFSLHCLWKIKIKI